MNIIRYSTEFFPTIHSGGGVNTLDMNHGQDPMGFMSVLTQDNLGHYAAYQGIVPDVSLWKDAKAIIPVMAQWVAQHGNKMSEARARAMFGELRGEVYRQ